MAPMGVPRPAQAAQPRGRRGLTAMRMSILLQTPVYTASGARDRVASDNTATRHRRGARGGGGAEAGVKQRPWETSAGSQAASRLLQH